MAEVQAVEVLARTEAVSVDLAQVVVADSIHVTEVVSEAVQVVVTAAVDKMAADLEVDAMISVAHRVMAEVAEALAHVTVAVASVVVAAAVAVASVVAEMPELVEAVDSDQDRQEADSKQFAFYFSKASLFFFLKLPCFGSHLFLKIS